MSSEGRPAKQVYCAFRMCSTGDDGKFEPPRSCAEKGCAGIFLERPTCRTFMRDPLAEEPAVVGISDIRLQRERRRHEFILRQKEEISGRDFLKVAKA